ncbi:hypothetical protein [Kribbella sp. NPDC051770]|uniref:hypothetical protein n=1 Tax=Kribbella sp. NPDC051770 TaxID=3155413 RepID=UPI003423775F
MTRYRLLVVLVASVAVAAVIAGGLLATRVSPSSQGTAAVPLAAKPLVDIDATLLATGPQPQVTFLRARTVHAPTGDPITVPGTAEIVGVARLWDTTFTIQRQGTGSALVVLDTEARPVNRIPGVDSLVSSLDGQAAAYAAGHLDAWTPGGTLYFQGPGDKPSATLARKNGYGLQVLRVAGRTVYFKSAQTAEVPPTLFRWDVDSQQVSPAGKAVEPTAVSADGARSANMIVHTDSGSCSALTETATGRQPWQTCQRQITGFSPTGTYAVGMPVGDWPFGPDQIWPLETTTGKPLREWKAPAIQDTRAEDDDHLLLAWHDRAAPGSRSALVRCTISTGQCELASPLSGELLLLGS